MTPIRLAPGQRSTPSRPATWLVVLGFAFSLACSGDAEPTLGAPIEPAVAPTPSIALSTEGLNATLAVGSADASYDITIGPGTAAPLTSVTVETVSSSPSQPWLAYSLSGTTAPAKLSIRISAIQQGTLTASLRISAAGAAPKLFSISIVVSTQAPTLVLERADVNVVAEPGSFAPRAQLRITSLNTTIVGLALSPIDCGVGRNWLVLDLDSHQTPAIVGISADAYGLTPSTYTCSFVVSTPQPFVKNASQTISVVLDVHFIPRLALSVYAVNINGIAGRTGAAFTVLVTNSAAGGVLDGLSLGPITYGPGGSGWLTATLPKSEAPAVLIISPSATQLSPGSYKASVPVLSSSTGVANSPAVLEVNFMVSPAGSLSKTAP